MQHKSLFASQIPINAPNRHYSENLDDDRSKWNEMANKLKDIFIVQVKELFDKECLLFPVHSIRIGSLQGLSIKLIATKNNEQSILWLQQ